MLTMGNCIFRSSAFLLTIRRRYRPSTGDICLKDLDHNNESNIGDRVLLTMAIARALRTFPELNLNHGRIVFAAAGSAIDLGNLVPESECLVHVRCLVRL